MRLAAVLGGLVACALLCVATGAQGRTDPPTTVDKDKHVRFTLDGRSLHVRVGADNRTRRALQGKSIDAICSNTYVPRRAGRVIERQLWPTGQNRLTYTFDRDISREVKWCLLEDQATDVAYALFGPMPGRMAVRTRVDESGGVPFEGALTYFRLRDARGRVVARKQGTRFSRLLAPGRYSLASWHRTCSGTCDNLDAPSGHTRLRFRVRSRRLTRLLLTVNYSKGSHISVVK